MKLRAVLEAGAAQAFNRDLGWGEFDVVECEDVENQAKELLTGASSLSDEIRGRWTSQVESLAKTLASWCPPWEVEAPGDDFPSKERVKSLVLNPDYKSLAPTANKLNEMLSRASALVIGGMPPVFTPEVLKNATTARDLGYSTMSLTYMVFKLLVEFPKLKDLDAKRKEAAKLREALKAKQFDAAKVAPALARKLAELGE